MSRDLPDGMYAVKPSSTRFTLQHPYSHYHSEVSVAASATVNATYEIQDDGFSYYLVGASAGFNANALFYVDLRVNGVYVFKKRDNGVVTWWGDDNNPVFLYPGDYMILRSKNSTAVTLTFFNVLNMWRRYQ